MVPSRQTKNRRGVFKTLSFILTFFRLKINYSKKTGIKPAKKANNKAATQKRGEMK